jgi:hypothetical protein
MKESVKALMLFALAVTLTTCLSDDKRENTVYFFDEPAVIQSLDESGAIIRSPHSYFDVPDLKDSLLKNGDLLWTSFRVNLDEKNPRENLYAPLKIPYVANSFSYVKVDSARVIIPDSVGEFVSYLINSLPIQKVVLYPDCLDHLLFFGFQMEGAASSKVRFDYEMVLSPAIESTNRYPTLYILPKKTETETDNYSSNGETIFAFDMTDFINYNKKHFADVPVVGFNLKYKYVVDEEGKMDYCEYHRNPILWNYY